MVSTPEMIEQRREIRIGRFVVDDEPGVDRDAADVHRVAVPSEPGIGFIERDVMALRQKPRRREARYPASDDRDLQLPDPGFPALCKAPSAFERLGSQSFREPDKIRAAPLSGSLRIDTG